MSQSQKPQINPQIIEEEMKEKAETYLKENEQVIILNRILYVLNNYSDNLDDTVEELARLYVSLKNNNYTVRTSIRSDNLYGYTIEETIPEVDDFDRRYVKVDLRLPNNILFGYIVFEYNIDSLLEKSNQIKLKQYKQQLCKIINAIKEGIEKSKQKNKEEEEENE